METQVTPDTDERSLTYTRLRKSLLGSAVAPSIDGSMGDDGIQAFVYLPVIYRISHKYELRGKGFMTDYGIYIYIYIYLEDWAKV